MNKNAKHVFIVTIGRALVVAILNAPARRRWGSENIYCLMGFGDVFDVDFLLAQAVSGEG